jgi:hypothetical protein
MYNYNWAWKKYYKNGWPVLLVVFIIALIYWMLESVFGIKLPG